MRTGRWIISHRYSRMAVYVFFCNARVSFHSVYSKGLVHETLFVNCPSVICLPNMLSLWRDTTSELWISVLPFPTVKQPQLKLCLLFCNLLSANNSLTIQYG